MSAVDGRADQLQACASLGALAFVILKKERRVAADLPDPCQLREDLDAVLRAGGRRRV